MLIETTINNPVYISDRWNTSKEHQWNDDNMIKELHRE